MTAPNPAYVKKPFSPDPFPGNYSGQENYNYNYTPANEVAEDLSWLRPRAITELTTTPPEEILCGMLYKACKGILMGGSKSYKTWTLMDVAYCVSNGLLWWDVHTLKTPVVYLDFELLEFDFRWRMEQIAKAHGKGSMAAVKRIGLRGKRFKQQHWPTIFEYVKGEGAGLVVADPTYKLLGPNRDENAAADIAQVTEQLEQLTEETGAAEVHAQHFSKGNQAGKESIDRAAGSGVWARDADTIITMTKHDAGDDCLTIETTLRSFPRIDPFVVRWELPLFKRDATLDPAHLKQAGPRKKKYCTDDLVKCLGTKDLGSSDFQKLLKAERGMASSTFYELLEKSAGEGKLYQSKIDGKWSVVHGKS